MADRPMMSSRKNISSTPSFLPLYGKIALLLAMMFIASCEHPFSTPSGIASGQMFSKYGSLHSMDLRYMFPFEDVRQLSRAAAKGDTKTIQKLLDEGVDVNFLGTRNATPLLYAFREKNLKGYTYLLEQGADPNILIPNGRTSGMYESVIEAAVSENELDYLKAALKHGGNSNLIDNHGKPLIFQTTYMNYHEKSIQTLKILLEHGANVNQKDIMQSLAWPEGWLTTLLSSTILHEDFRKALLVLDSGANPEAANTRGENSAFYLNKTLERLEYLDDVQTLSGDEKLALDELVKRFQGMGYEIDY